MRLAPLAASLGLAGCTAINPLFGIEGGAAAGSATDGDGTQSGGGATQASSGDVTGGGGGTGTGTTTTTTDTSAGPGPVDTGPVDTGPVDTDPVESTGPAPAACGNGVLEMGEQCDAGPNPPLKEGACLPTCDGVIPKKLIFAGGAIAGDFAMNGGVPFADQTCVEIAAEKGVAGTFKAVLSDGQSRYAALAPYDASQSKDWPIPPYTAYTNPSDLLVWVTGKIPLLGVTDQPNQSQPLINPIVGGGDMVAAWTGMAGDWTTAQTCSGWTSLLTSGHGGWAHLTTGYLDGLANSQCEKTFGFICVEV